jgi:putative flavoprotein involved in K+ transport
MELPVHTGVRIERLGRRDGLFEARSADRRWLADNVVVAMAGYQKPHTPDFAGELAPRIRQLHSAQYRNPGQLVDGPVLLVGAANSGADIAIELAGDRRVWMSGTDVGEIPFRPSGFLGRALLVRLVLRVVFHRVLTVRTPLGRAARPKWLHKAPERVRVKTRDLDAAGVERVPRTKGVVDGRPVLEDGRALEPANVIWCTGFRPGFDWIDRPVHGPDEPNHRSGIVPSEPGLFFVGLTFLHAVSSSMIHGVGRDAARIADAIAARGGGVRMGGERAGSALAGR